MPPPPLAQPALPAAAHAAADGVAKDTVSTEGPAATAGGRYKKSDPLLKAPLPLPAPPSRAWRSPKIRPPATPGDAAAAVAEVPASAETILGSKAPAEPASSLGAPSLVSASVVSDASPTPALELASSSATPASVSSSPASSAVSNTPTAKISLAPALAPGVSSLNAPSTATGVLLTSSAPKKLTRPIKPVVAAPPLDSHAKDYDADAVENDGYFDPLEEYLDDIGPPSRAGSDPSTQDLDWAGDITLADLEEELAAIEEVLDGPIGNPMSEELGPVIPDSLLPAKKNRIPDDGRSDYPASDEAGAMDQMREMMLEIAAIEELDEAANNAGLDADVSSDSVLSEGDDGLIVADDVPPPLEDSKDPYIAGDSTDDGRENNHRHHVKGLGKHEKKKKKNKHKSKKKHKKSKHERRPKHARPHYQDSSDGGESSDLPAVDQNTHIIDLSSENISLGLPQAAGPTNATNTASLRALARAALGRGGVLLGLGDTTAGAVAAGTLAAFVFLASLSIVAAVVHCACAARRRARAAERQRAAWFRAAGRVRYQRAGADDPDRGGAAGAADGDDDEEKVPNVPCGEEDDDDDDTLGSGDGVGASGTRGSAGPWASSEPGRAGDVFVARSGY
ncbi:hypothetical protein HK405_014692 [Cladochytrium tenue]|nr:hypothetical protein HK405_014692 [Cladochytrium tenue]